jgi:hypothetical protein
MKIDITIPELEGSEHEEFGWPPIDDPVGSPKVTTIDFFDAGTKKTRVTDFVYTSSFTLSGNWEDVIIIGAPIIIEYEVVEDGETVTKTLDTEISNIYILSENSVMFSTNDIPSEGNVIAFYYWKDCSNWSNELISLFSGNGGPYNFLSYWGHPTSFSMNIYGNEDSRVPAGTISSEFDANNSTRFDRKPLGAFQNFVYDEYDRTQLANGLYSIDMRLKKFQEQTKESDPGNKLECSPLLLTNSDTKWKAGTDQLEYKRRSMLGRYDLEIREVGSASIAHYFYSYHEGDDGEYNGEFKLKYYPELVKRTIKNDEGNDIKDPVGMFFSPFNTSDLINFKLTSEPTYSAEEYSGKPIKAGKKYKVFLMPRRWAYYTRVRETTIGANQQQLSATITYSSDNIPAGYPTGSLVNYYLIYYHDQMLAQGPLQGGKTMNDVCTGCCISGALSCDPEHCYCLKYSGDCDNPDSTYNYGDPCSMLYDYCFCGYTRTSTMSVSGCSWQNDYRIGIFWDRFPNQLSTIYPSTEELSSSPELLNRDSYAFDPQLTQHEQSFYDGHFLTATEIYSIISGVKVERHGVQSATIPGIADWSSERLITDFPFIMDGFNAFNLVSFYTDETPYQSGLGGSFLGPWLIGGQVPGHTLSTPGLMKVPYRAQKNADNTFTPINPANHRSPFTMVRQYTSDNVGYLKQRWVPISLGAFHSPLITKWNENSGGSFTLFDQIWRKVSGVPDLYVSEMDELESPKTDLRWLPSNRASSFWTAYGIPAYNVANDYSKRDNIPIGVGISPDKAGALVGIIVQGTKPTFIWRKTDEEFSLGTVTLPNEVPFASLESYTGHFQSFETTFESGYSHCNDLGTPTNYNEIWDGDTTGATESGDLYDLELAAMGYCGWGDEMEYEFVDQFTGPGTRELTHVGRSVQTELIYTPQINANTLAGGTGTSWATPSSDVLKDYRIIANGDGQYELDVPIFIMFSREMKIPIPNEKSQYMNDWPYPKCRVNRNNYAGWGSTTVNNDDPDGLYPTAGYRYRCNAPVFPY